MGVNDKPKITSEYLAAMAKYLQALRERKMTLEEIVWARAVQEGQRRIMEAAILGK